ncbi:MAG: GTP cyclohydrolase I FolE2 [Spirochaetaceae bacterium]|nr:MAG: GTP cyclohydrolase I FolE2 [Spirochaetaceae bacterium]
MVDVQSRGDSRNIPIQKVGIRRLRYPVSVLDKHAGRQSSVATVDLLVDLPHHYKGTHMSRFVEVFHAHYKQVEMPHFLDMLEEVRVSLEAERAYCELRFPYYMEKKAPVSGLPSLLYYDCSFTGEVSATDRHFVVGVDVPVTTLCPCSKEISARGAHNQRGRVGVKLELGPFFWIEDVIEIVENAASCGIYTLLKREDERYVTERAYDNPAFVEDLVRDVCLGIEKRYEFPWFSVEAENNESIHSHDAFAYLERRRDQVAATPTKKPGKDQP